MYKKNNEVFAEVGYILTGNNGTGYRMTGELTDFTERQLDLSNITIEGDMVSIDGVLHGYDASMGFEQLVEKWMKAQYSQEEQVTVIQNQEENPQEYERMLKWRYWCEELAHAILDDVDLDIAKQQKIREISQYDSSTAVNEFTFGGRTMWLDDATRTKLAKRFDTDEQDGKTDTKLIYDGVSYDLPIQQARAMLHQIESYARDCFDKTNEHKAAVMALGSIDAVHEYNYTVGYPTKLNFDTMFSE